MSPETNPSPDTSSPSVPNVDASLSESVAKPAASPRKARIYTGVVLLGLVALGAYANREWHQKRLAAESIAALQKAGLNVEDNGRLTFISDPTNDCVTNDCMQCVRDLNRALRLELANCPQITDEGLAHLQGHDQIRVLVLSQTGVTDAGVGHFSGMESLEVLDLSLTGITDAGLAKMPGLHLESLQDLSLIATGVTDAGLEHLAQIPSLRIVTLQGTKVTSEGAQKLRAARPEILILGL